MAITGSKCSRAWWRGGKVGKRDLTGFNVWKAKKSGNGARHHLGSQPVGRSDALR